MREYNYTCTCTNRYTALIDDTGQMVAIKVVMGGKEVQKNDCVCPYCRQRVTPTNMRQAKACTNGDQRKLTMAILSMQKNIQTNPDDAASHLALGLFFIMKGGYSDARIQLKKAIDLDPMNDSAYFYSCVALLNGMNPSRAETGKIKLIEERLQICENLAQDDQTRAMYYYFHAFIKYDFFTKKYLRTTPTYQELLYQAMGCGLTVQDRDELFEILRVPRPGCM